MCIRDSFYGGGFKAAPLAKTNDGLLDVLLVDKVSRKRFLSLVADYKKGLHLDHDTNNVIPRFSDIMTYKRCKNIKINTPVYLCADGEITKQASIEISVVPNIIKFISL